MDTRILEYGLLKYTVDAEITSSDGNSVKVTFFDESLTVIEQISLKVVTADHIYQLIKSKSEIDLKAVYIKDFSLSDYRKLHGLNPHDEIEITDFRATGVFFDCGQTTDFSHACFTGKTVDFSHSVFGNGRVDFSNVRFNDAVVKFRHTRFGSGTKNFQSAVFGKGDVSFRSASFGNGDVLFSDVFFWSWFG